MAFKRLRLNPFQNYRSITSVSVDWPRTIRLVYVSVSILSVCAIMLLVIVIQTRWNTERLTKEFYKQKSRVRHRYPSKKRRQKNKGILWLGYHMCPNKNLVVRHVARPFPCMTTPIIIKITRVISMWTPNWITVSCHGVDGPMTTGYYCAIFPFCGGGKKKTTKKQRHFMTGLPQVSQ